MACTRGTGVKAPPANTGDIGDAGSISGSGRSPGEGMAIHSSILAWEIAWTEEPGRLESMGSQESEIVNKQQKQRTLFTQ